MSKIVTKITFMNILLCGVVDMFLRRPAMRYVSSAYTLMTPHSYGPLTLMGPSLSWALTDTITRENERHL